MRLTCARVALVLLCPAFHAYAMPGPYANRLLTDATSDVVEDFGATLAFGDYDGDGRPDLAIASNLDFDHQRAGRVVVYLTRDGDLTHDPLLDTLRGAPGQRFGAALVACDLDDDGQDELLIATPGDTVNGVAGAGSVAVYRRNKPSPPPNMDAWSWTALRASRATTGGAAMPDEHFGRVLACGDFDDDGHGDLAIGTPAANNAAGDVVVVPGSPGGLLLASATRWFQGAMHAGATVGGTAEAGDLFGAALAAGDFDRDGHHDLAIGAPGEDLSAIDRAGVVHVLFGSSSGVAATKQNQFNANYFASAFGEGEPAAAWDALGTSLAVGDFNRPESLLQIGFPDLVIGAPGKTNGSAEGAGAVYVLDGGAGNATFDAMQMLHTESFGNHVAQAGEGFGLALAVGNVDGDRQDDLLIARSGRDIDLFEHPGDVMLFHGFPSGFSGFGLRVLYASRGYASAPPQADAGFGHTLATADIDGDHRSDLAIGIEEQATPGNADFGAVQLVFTRGLFVDEFEF